MVCIFCDNENNATSVEHIIPESFGNKIYLMPLSSVCDICNRKFSEFECIALSNSIFAMERAILGIVTKKSKNVKGRINNLIIEGDDKFRKYLLSLKGLNENNIIKYDPKKRIGEFFIPAFDKSEVATSKLLLKMSLESMFVSQNKTFIKYNFSELKDFLKSKNNKDWPFMTSELEIKKFRSIPSYNIKNTLKNQNFSELKFLELNDETLLFKFKFGGVSMQINMLDRNLHWIKQIIKNEEIESIYPEHYRKKALK